MKKLHLTDNDIQNFLDGNIHNSSKEKLINEHIDLCSECAEKYKNYKMLYTRLSDEHELTIPTDFSVRVMKTISAQVESGGKILGFWQWIGLIMATVFSIGMIFYYGGMHLMENIPFYGFSSFNSLLNVFFNQIAVYIPFSSLNISLLIYILLLLLVLRGIDKFMMHLKIHE